MPDDDEKNEDKGSRMDAAKAFFRAMYAGEEPAAGENQGETPTGSAPADSRRVKELEQQTKELEQRAIDAENLYKRMAADFDNFRRRMEREREEFTNAGVRKAAEAIIPALDDLDRALMYLSPDTSADKIIESFQLVANRVVQCLEQAGLKRLSTKGVLFDPRFHEPVQQIETTEQPDGTIVHELRGGYVLGDRVIRPALVNVALNNTVVIEPVFNSGQSAEAQPKPTEPTPIPLGPQGAAGQAKTDQQSSSVATATEEKTDEAAKAKTSTSPEPDDKVYDLGDL